MISKRDLLLRIQALEAGMSAETKLRHSLSNRLDQHLNAEDRRHELPKEGIFMAMVQEVSPPTAYSSGPSEPTQYSVRFRLTLEGGFGTVFMHMGGTLDTCQMLYDMRGSLGGRKMRVDVKHKRIGHSDRIGIHARFLSWADRP